ncbi:hypothetical protein [Halomicronema sp. CCY15110]|uniref:hypothetical protein n=1 Tax=Halomicronema sp. CCY15110 TaxID=2767773 RepID=UPI00194EE737|nr:hypothetical protein [Halomicronema sp. CCY15110]
MTTQQASTELAYVPLDSLQNSRNAEFPENMGMLLFFFVMFGLLGTLIACLASE